MKFKALKVGCPPDYFIAYFQVQALAYVSAIGDRSLVIISPG
jgi:hypothetical protein